jgi:peptidoglycan/xylan/chitin deacetylase (PgdA/CDA1 family)
MKKNLILTLGMILLLTACGGTPVTLSQPVITETPLPPAITFSAAQTFTPTAAEAPTIIPTATWVKQGPGDITVPILLYHHIDISPIDSRYYVTPKKFEEEIKLLHDWGYTTITTTQLVQAITLGTKLPPRPILITFDDGHADNYTNAFPIMQKYGFTGVLYLVYNYLNTDQYLNTAQVLEMTHAGWEVGSHTINHVDLTKLSEDKQRREIVESRQLFEQKFGVPILTFAYPFGYENPGVLDYAHFAGYIGAMGASGYTPAQGTWNLYNLQRVEIKGTDDAKTFTRFLPWKGDPAYLPTDTPTPHPAP